MSALNQTRPIGGRLAPGLKLGLVLFAAAALLACGSLGVDPGSLSGTAQALAQTAQVGAGTAFAGVPGTATVLAATVSAKLTQLAPTLVAGGQSAGTAVANLPGTAAAAEATLAVQASQFAPTGEALATQVVSAAGTAVTDPAEASAAITAYAQQVLGISVTIVKAGGLTGDIQHLIVVPQAGDAAQNTTAKVAAKTYGAILNGGAASVSYGSGAVSGDLKVELNAASLGAFSLDATAAPKNAGEALQLALQTYPALASQSFTAFPTTQGYSWVAQGKAPGYDSTTKQPGLVAQAVLLSVVPIVLGHNIVSAVVGKGDFASNLLP